MRPWRSALRSVSAAVAAILWPAVTLAAVARWRLAPAELPYAWPGPGVGFLTAPGVVILGAAAVVAVLVAFAAQPRASRAELPAILLWPALPLTVAWALLPLETGPGLSTLFWTLPLAAIGFVLWRTRPDVPPARGGRHWHEGWIWRAAHALGLLTVVVAGLSDLRGAAVSFLLYPLYAAVQLALVLAVCWPRLVVATEHRGVTSVVLGGLFALVHWPNPLLMVLTGLGMALWARGYSRGRPLWVLAISMGLLATVVAQALPETWTQQMCVGPRSVRERAVEGLTTAVLDTLPRGADRDHEAPAFIAALYPGSVGRVATKAELERWETLVERERRAFLAWTILSSGEHRQRFPGNSPPAMDGSHYWTDLTAPWPHRIRHFTAMGLNDTWPDFVRRCYGRFLGRSPSETEVATWARDLGHNQYERLVAVLLERRRSLATKPGAELDGAEFHFWR